MLPSIRTLLHFRSFPKFDSTSWRGLPVFPGEGERRLAVGGARNAYLALRLGSAWPTLHFTFCFLTIPNANAVIRSRIAEQTENQAPHRQVEQHPAEHRQGKGRQKRGARGEDQTARRADQ